MSLAAITAALGLGDYKWVKDKLEKEAAGREAARRERCNEDYASTTEGRPTK